MGRPVSGWILPTAWKRSLVLEGGLVAAALLGEAVHDDRAAEALGAGEGGLQGLDVVAVDRADVLQAQVLEHALRGDEVLQALLGAVQGVVERAADDRGPLQDLLGAGQEALVAVGGAQGRQVVGEAADGGGVGALVVVDDDDEGAVLGGGDVVQRLPGHAAGEGAVTDDGDHVVVAVEDLVGLGDAVGPAEHCGGVAVLDDVVLGLGLRGVAGQAALHLQLREVLASGEQLVHVGLVAGVPEHLVLRRVEDAVQGEGELHHAEVGAEVAAGLGDGVDEEGADLLCQPAQLFQAEPVQIARSRDAGQQRHPCLLAVELLPGLTSLMFRRGGTCPGGGSYVTRSALPIRNRFYDFPSGGVVHPPSRRVARAGPGGRRTARPRAQLGRAVVRRARCAARRGRPSSASCG